VQGLTYIILLQRLPVKNAKESSGQRCRKNRATAETGTFETISRGILSVPIEPEDWQRVEQSFSLGQYIFNSHQQNEPIARAAASSDDAAVFLCETGKEMDFHSIG